MKFSHLVQINDPLNPLLDPITRDQLWRGLVLRAEQPKSFIPWLDACDLLDRGEGEGQGQATTIARRLRYGELLVRDVVTFTPQSHIRYDIPQQKDIPASSLAVTIEEPQVGLLFVRFQYDDGNGDAQDAANEMYNDFRRSAYVESDIDTIRIIREWAADGRLGNAA